MPFQDNSLFRDMSDRSLQIVSDFIAHKKNTFLMPTRFISPEAGQIGYLLDEYFNWGRKNRVGYRTFFTNSGLEAVQVAIKIARHNAFNKQLTKKDILIFDVAGEMEYLVGPLGLEKGAALIPGIDVMTGLNQAMLSVRDNDYLAVVIRNRGVSFEDLVEFMEECKKKRIITVLECGDLDFKDSSTLLLHKLLDLPDIIVIGEALTNNEMPIGSVSMSVDIHKPWASMQTCMMHSSTYAANNLVLEKAKEVLLSFHPFSAGRIKSICSRIQLSKKARLKAFAKYINPGLVELYKLIDLDICPIKAYGSKLLVGKSGKSKHEVIDCVTGGGAAVRGHVPEDVIADVVNSHAKDEDYWQRLADLLKTITGFDHVFPAVSGATAVDIGITLALLANSDKKKIVTFSENYAGKTLLSLNLTADEIWRVPFYPLYEHMIYINPWGPNAREELTDILTSGEVALVWFELIQGANAKAIPEDLLSIINKYKQEYKYVVGLDEILMGSYRCGKRFAYEGKSISPDIITLSKSLSDGVFPVGATLVSSSVFEQAIRTNQEVVNYHLDLYKNQFGSHVAYNCINNTWLSSSYKRNVTKAVEIMDRGFRELGERSSLLKSVDHAGMFYKLNYDTGDRIKMMFGGLGDWLFKLFVCRQCLRKGIFIFFDRCIPALNISEDEIKIFMRRINMVFNRSRYNFYLSYTLFVARVVFMNVFGLAKSRIRRIFRLGGGDYGRN